MQFRVCVLMCLSLAGCGASSAIQSFSADAGTLQPDERSLGKTFVYDCNGYEFIARLGPGEMAIWFPDEYVILSRVRSASGSLYEEGDISFWSKGNDAMLTVGGQSYMDCKLQPERVPWEDARRRAVDFRAVGNEPGWHLEIQSGRQLLLVLGYGMQRILVSEPAEIDTGATRFYKGNAGERAVQVEIIDQACMDSMSGEQFPSRVVVTLDNAYYEGCGQNLDYPWADIE